MHILLETDFQLFFFNNWIISHQSSANNADTEMCLYLDQTDCTLKTLKYYYFFYFFSGHFKFECYVTK